MSKLLGSPAAPETVEERVRRDHSTLSPSVCRSGRFVGGEGRRRMATTIWPTIDQIDARTYLNNFALHVRLFKYTCERETREHMGIAHTHTNSVQPQFGSVSYRVSGARYVDTAAEHTHTSGVCVRARASVTPNLYRIFEPTDGNVPHKARIQNGAVVCGGHTFGAHGDDIDGHQGG